MEDLIKVEKFRVDNGYSESDKASVLFGISNNVSQSLYELGMKFNFNTFKFEGNLPINDTILKVTLYRDQDSHAKRYSIVIRDKNNNSPKDFKGKDSTQVYYDLSYNIQESGLYTIVYLFLENYYRLNSKDKESFKKFVEAEKSNS